MFKNKYMKAAIWIVLNAAMGYSAYWWLYLGNEFVGNALSFYLWINLIISVGWYALSTKIKPDDEIISRSVPAWIAVTFDFSLMLFLAAYSHYVLASVVFVQCVQEASTFNNFENERKRRANTN